MTNSLNAAAPADPVGCREAWGFWARMKNHAAAAWPLAAAAIVRATLKTPDAARAFLGSHHGRLFADSVRDRLIHDRSLVEAIDDATRQWMQWTTSPLLNRTYGVPVGVPCLTGFVAHYGRVGEAGLVRRRSRL